MGWTDILPSSLISTAWLDRFRPAALTRRLSKDLFIGLLVGITLSLSSTSAALYLQQYRRKKAIQRMPPGPIELRSEEIGDGVIGLIGESSIYSRGTHRGKGGADLAGNTPLIRINSLSDALGVEILGKCEFLNPGGSVKDRVALKIIQDAENDGLLHPHTGSVLFEGTVGSTGISLATVGRAKGYECCIIMPDDVAIEKVQVLEKLGAKVERVRPASYVDEKQFVNMARRRALEFGRTEIPITSAPLEDKDILVTSTAAPSLTASSNGPSKSGHRVRFTPSIDLKTGYGVAALNALDSLVPTPSDVKNIIDAELQPRGFFADQFENQSNFDAHYQGTGPEILKQVNGQLDAFVSGAGTGGTISGIGRYLKKHVPDVKVVLSDPEGSGLFNKVKYNVMYDSKESEGKKRRHQVDTVVEGIGINRITHNFSQGLDIIDDAYRISDEEAVAMSRYLVQHDGLYLGSSSACNLVAAVKLAKRLGHECRIATILCDSGSRHQSKFWSDEYLNAHNIPIRPELINDLLHT